MNKMTPPSLDVIDWHVFRLAKTYDLQEVNRWCEKNIKKKWSRSSGAAGCLSFFIESGDDAMIFKLTWGHYQVKFS